MGRISGPSESFLRSRVRNTILYLEKSVWVPPEIRNDKRYSCIGLERKVHKALDMLGVEEWMQRRYFRLLSRLDDRKVLDMNKAVVLTAIEEFERLEAHKYCLLSKRRKWKK